MHVVNVKYNLVSELEKLLTMKRCSAHTQSVVLYPPLKWVQNVSGSLMVQSVYLETMYRNLDHTRDKRKCKGEF